ncbi:unnamed protein product [Linum trigynum]|uniref:Uncharacterized protein n=1 Tax=Linum trigynum TaxID=586398 RepID=A0AAV2D683_9ROSI
MHRCPRPYKLQARNYLHELALLALPRSPKQPPLTHRVSLYSKRASSYSVVKCFGLLWNERSSSHEFTFAIALSAMCKTGQCLIGIFVNINQVNEARTVFEAAVDMADR